MQQKKLIWLALAALSVATLASCNVGKAPEPTPDVNAIYTNVAQTMVSQFNSQATQTAQAMPPTALPSPIVPTFAPLPTLPVAPGATAFVFSTPSVGGLPTATLIPLSSGGTPGGSTAVGCSNAAFLQETIPDGTVITAGNGFKKVWQFQNTGTCTWDTGFSFVFVSGDQMDGNNIDFSKAADAVKPGRGTSFIVKMTAPTKAGTYKGFWQMKDDKGNFFGSRVWVSIVVK